jgi:hypothetical protein
MVDCQFHLKYTIRTDDPNQNAENWRERNYKTEANVGIRVSKVGVIESDRLGLTHYGDQNVVHYEYNVSRGFKGSQKFTEIMRHYKAFPDYDTMKRMPKNFNIGVPISEVHFKTKICGGRETEYIKFFEPAMDL